MFKIVLCFALVSQISCGVLPYYYPAAPAIIHKTIEIQTTTAASPPPPPPPAAEPIPEYQFQYSVNNPETGDIKSQEESRKGDDVKGSYTLIDADGFRRIVTYTASEENGFQAEVRREPIDATTTTTTTTAAPVIVKKIIASPAVVAAPTYTKIISPAAPAIISSSFSSPIIKYNW